MNEILSTVNNVLQGNAAIKADVNVEMENKTLLKLAIAITLAVAIGILVGAGVKTLIKK